MFNVAQNVPEGLKMSQMVLKAPRISHNVPWNNLLCTNGQEGLKISQNFSKCPRMSQNLKASSVSLSTVNKVYHIVYQSKLEIGTKNF